LQRDSAMSPVMATTLLVAITIILAAIIAAMLLYWPLLQFFSTPVPAIFTITNIDSTDEITKKINFDSRVIIINSGTASYQNKNLKAIFYKNGVKVNANIQTLNGHDFISTVHTGVQWMGGMGCEGLTWTPGEMTAIDLNDGTFRPGDSVQIDIIDNSTTNQIISRHTYLVK
jgi:FlaG/FlaF family flagellin (archaellin)